MIDQRVRRVCELDSTPPFVFGEHKASSVAGARLTLRSLLPESVLLLLWSETAAHNKQGGFLNCGLALLISHTHSYDIKGFIMSSN